MKPATSAPSIPDRRISFFFLLILLVELFGFYKTYIIFSPSFTGFNAIHHFHGAMMMTWVIILIVQPILIASGKQSVHRLIGKFTYIIAPLVVVSLFLISKFNYLSLLPTLPPNVSIGSIALNIPAIAAFIIFYCLAIIYRHNTYHHLRFMIGTAVLIIGPGLVRILMHDFNVDFLTAIDWGFYTFVGISAVLLLNDMLRKRNFTAYAIVLAVFIANFLLWKFRLSQPWQSIGEFIAINLF